MYVILVNNLRFDLWISKTEYSGTSKKKKKIIYITVIVESILPTFLFQFLLESFMVYSLVLDIEQQVTSKFCPKCYLHIPPKKATNKVVKFFLKKKVYTYPDEEETKKKKIEKRIHSIECKKGIVMEWNGKVAKYCESK